MTTHIEFHFSQAPEGSLIGMLETRLPLLEPSTTYNQEFVKESDTEYYFAVGKLPYLRHRRFLMAVCRDLLQGIPMKIIFDVSGDHQDETLVIIWDGKDFTFSFWCM
jgi:hypothetical protein